MTHRDTLGGAMRFSPGHAALLSALACDSAPSPPTSPVDAGDASRAPQVLDCAWASGPNCWKAVLAPAMSCLPPASDVGTISADGTTCTYATGTTVTFAPPLMVGQGAKLARFTVTTGGSPCLTFAENDAGTGGSVTTQGGTVSVTENVAAQSLTVTCADGSEYTGYARELASCDAGVPSYGIGPPGSGQSADSGLSHGGVGVSLNDTGAANPTVVFNCAN
jgi:hypothetical protein